jgi:hypothetical protein
MTSAGLHESSIHIGRLYNNYRVPLEHTAPEDARRMCENAIAATLSARLATALNASLPASDPSLWFIRRLEVDFAVNTGMSPPALAQVWAKEIASGLAGALQIEDDEAVHFPDRATYLAHFLLDLAEGSAWDKWYYELFDGLRMLSISAALRTAICDSAETGLRTLCSLDEAGCNAVLRKINASDASRILDALGNVGVASDGTDCFTEIGERWQAMARIAAREEERRALLLFLSVTRNKPALAGLTLSDAARAISRLARLLQESSANDERLLEALRRRELDKLYRLAGLKHAPVLGPLLRCSSGCLDSLLQRITGGPIKDPVTRQETRFTAFGGAFMLLPILDQFPLHEATHGWPDLESVNAVALVRFLLLAKCFGRIRASGCLNDSLIRDRMRIPPQLTPIMVRSWLTGISSENTRTFLAAISQWHVETGAIKAEEFTVLPVAQKGAPAVVVMDGARGLWLSALRQPENAVHPCDSFSEVPAPAKVFCHESLMPAASKSFPHAHIEALPATAAPSVSRDMAYLTLPREYGRPDADLALSVAAQGVVRLFSSKLPGFARSSMDYLSTNFLDCSGAVQEKSKQRVVFLSRPALHMVLGMAGLNRCAYRLSWLDEKPWAIFPEE